MLLYHGSYMVVDAPEADYSAASVRFWFRFLLDERLRAGSKKGEPYQLLETGKSVWTVPKL